MRRECNASQFGACWMEGLLEMQVGCFACAHKPAQRDVLLQSSLKFKHTQAASANTPGLGVQGGHEDEALQRAIQDLRFSGLDVEIGGRLDEGNVELSALMQIVSASRNAQLGILV